MNKLLTKIVGAVLGASMAVGVGVGVAVNNDRKEINSEVNASVTLDSGFTAATMTGVTQGSACTVDGDDGIKCGTSKAGGAMKVTVPSGATTLRIYAGAWSGKTVTLNITSSTSATTSSSIDLSGDAGFSGNSPFTLSGNKSDYRFDLTLSGVTSSTDFTFTGSNNNRFVVWDAQYKSEGGGGTVTNVTRAISGPNNMEKVAGDAALDISSNITIEDENPAEGYTVSSSNSNVVSVSGTTLSFEAAGTATITISKASHSETVGSTTTNYSYTSHTFSVSVSIPELDLPDMPDGDYELVTSKTDVTSGYYLIVNGTSAFEASLGTLDTSSNFVSVTDNEGVISATSSLNTNAVYLYGLGDYSFYILAHLSDEDGYVYMGRDANSNGLDQSQTTQYTNTVVSVSNDGVAKIQAAGSKCFGFVSSKFRYYAESNANIKLYKKTATTPAEDVYTTSITVSPKTATVALGDTVDLTATLDQDVTVTTVTWSADPNNSGVSVAPNGTVTVAANATIDSIATITATVANSSTTTITDTATITVGPKKLTGLSRTGYDAYYVGQKIGDYVGGAITASWTAGEDTNVSLDNANLSITLGGSAVTKDTVLTASDDQKQIQFTYQDPNYALVSKYTPNRKVSVGQYFELEDLVAHYDGGVSYILSPSDNGDSYLSFAYKSWGGQAELTVNVSSSNEDLLVASISTHTFSNRAGSGTIGLLSDGESKGQAIVTLNATVNETTLTKAFVVTVRNTAPSVTPGSTSYQLIESIDDVTSDDYVIAANVGGTYYAMPNTFAAKIDGSTVSVSNGKITADMSDYVVTLTRSGSNLSIYNGSLYLKVQTSGTDLTSQSSLFNNTFGEGNIEGRGSFKISNTRALVFRAGSTNKFGNYATNNVTANGEYYYVELFKKVSEGGTSDDTTVVQEFVNSWMHPEIDPSNKSDTGACKGENGYYKKAKDHIISDLDGKQRKIFRDDFDVYYKRMQDWAVAYGETFIINNSGEVVTTPTSSANGLLNPIAESNSIATVVIVISVLSLTTLGGYFLLRKRKEEN